MLQVAAAAALWGTWSLFLRPAGLPATVTAPVVIGLVGLFAAPAALAEPRVALDRAAWRWVALGAALEAINVVTFFGAMRVTTNAVAVLTHYLAPVLVAVFAPWVEGQRVPRARPAALLAITGLTLVLRPWSHESDPQRVLGATLGLVSALAYAGNVFVLRRTAHALGPARAQLARCVLAAALLAPGIALGPAASWSARGAILLALGALVPGAIAGLLFARGLLRAGAARASVLTYLEPLVSVLLGVLVWGEPAGPWTAFGALLVLAAGALVSLAR
jgi:DME family drug/metabolite transporter